MNKVFAAAAAFGLTATTAFAGGLSEPVVEAEPMMQPEVVVEESSGTSGGFVIPLMLLALIAAVASNSGGDADLSDG